MNKLTAEIARQDLNHLKSWVETCGISMKEERYMQALEIALPVLEQQEKGDDGWLEWGGGENPAEGKLVQVEFRDGFVDDEQPSGGYRWYHEPNNCDIIAYRVVQQERERGEEE